MYEIRCKLTEQPAVYGIPQSVWNEEFANRLFRFRNSQSAQVTIYCGNAEFLFELPPKELWQASLVEGEAVKAMECWEDYGAYKRRW